ncbi:hypothetical protein BS47DRAFT_1388908 [Hydnum rufescens UP504]|uniref:Uncharacterized protein n=1 Tax=Hydnum rufescens UP504 TaxID=1448309 RepID=A0A9P6E1G9_9AGAM|nr:hypothetical protein BS47DRAFT_1388908 [Hydnum rufescens UP504]
MGGELAGRFICLPSHFATLWLQLKSKNNLQFWNEYSFVLPWFVGALSAGLFTTFSSRENLKPGQKTASSDTSRSDGLHPSTFYGENVQYVTTSLSDVRSSISSRRAVPISGFHFDEGYDPTDGLKFHYVFLSESLACGLSFGEARIWAHVSFPGVIVIAAMFVFAPLHKSSDVHLPFV